MCSPTSMEVSHSSQEATLVQELGPQVQEVHGPLVQDHGARRQDGAQRQVLVEILEVEVEKEVVEFFQEQEVCVPLFCFLLMFPVH